MKGDSLEKRKHERMKRAGGWSGIAAGDIRRKEDERNRDKNLARDGEFLRNSRTIKRHLEAVGIGEGAEVEIDKGEVTLGKFNEARMQYGLRGIGKSGGITVYHLYNQLVARGRIRPCDESCSHDSDDLRTK